MRNNIVRLMVAVITVVVLEASAWALPVGYICGYHSQLEPIYNTPNPEWGWRPPRTDRANTRVSYAEVRRYVGLETYYSIRTLQWSAFPDEQFEVGTTHYDMVAGDGSERVKFYGRVGIAQTDFNDQEADYDMSFSSSSGLIEGSWDLGFGLQGVLYDGMTVSEGKKQGWQIAGDIQGMYTMGTGRFELAVDGEGMTDYADADIAEWQAAVQVQGAYRNFRPYLGVKYSDYTFTLSPASFEPEDFNGDSSIGVYGGASIKLTDNVGMYLEGEFGDEASFSCGLGFGF